MMHADYGDSVFPINPGMPQLPDQFWDACQCRMPCLSPHGQLALTELLQASFREHDWMAVSWSALMHQMMQAIEAAEQKLPTRDWRQDWGGGVLMDGMRELKTHGLVSINDDAEDQIFKATRTLALIFV